VNILGVLYVTTILVLLVTGIALGIAAERKAAKAEEYRRRARSERARRPESTGAI
jgi:hypothetical protein